MKKNILLFVAILISVGAYAQSFTDGSTHFILQYDPNASNAGCLTTFDNTGGSAFAGGNVDYVGYSTCSGCSPSPEAIYLFGTEGSIDNVVSPYYFNVFYTGTACDEMDGFTAGTPKGIDLSVSKKVFVTAKANGNTTVEFFLANGVNNAFPGAAVGSGTWETFSYTVGDAPAIAMNLTTGYATYEIDFSGIAAFDTWAGRTKVNQWGIRMTQPSAEVWIKTIEFGVASTNTDPTVSITSPADAAEFDEGIDITIDADAADADGSVAKVEFYYGAVKIGEDLTSPYSITWSGAAAGTHSLTAVATDDLGATTTSTAVSVTVNAVAGITNSLKAKQISLYPNPSNGDVSIKTSGREGQIVITNTQGVVVETVEVKGQQDMYQINALEKGIYVVKFTTAGNSTTERLIVQ